VRGVHGSSTSQCGASSSSTHMRSSLKGVQNKSSSPSSFSTRRLTYPPTRFCSREGFLRPCFLERPTVGFSSSLVASDARHPLRGGRSLPLCDLQNSCDRRDPRRKRGGRRFVRALVIAAAPLLTGSVREESIFHANISKTKRFVVASKTGPRIRSLDRRRGSIAEGE